MQRVRELWEIAHGLYARARSSVDPLAKEKLMRCADIYMKRAEEIRRAAVVKAEFPSHSGLGEFQNDWPKAS